MSFGVGIGGVGTGGVFIGDSAWGLSGRCSLCLLDVSFVRSKELRKKRITRKIVTLFKKLVGPAPPKIASAPLNTAPYSEPFVTLTKTISIIKIARMI